MRPTKTGETLREEEEEKEVKKGKKMHLLYPHHIVENPAKVRPSKASKTLEKKTERQRGIEHC